MTKKSVNQGRQMKFARNYRGYSQTKVAQNVENVSQSNLSRFEKGFENILSEDKVKDIMLYLDFPMKFLEKRIYNESTTFFL